MTDNGAFLEAFGTFMLSNCPLSFLIFYTKLHNMGEQQPTIIGSMMKRHRVHLARRNLNRAPRLRVRPFNAPTLTTDRFSDQGEETPEIQQKELKIMGVPLLRRHEPKPSDGELYVLKMPRFLAFQTAAFKPETFELPQAEHYEKQPSSAFSAYDTAMTTLRWRRSPSNMKQLQSNARVLRWSDGSLTLQLASDPTAQYEISAEPLAPRQVNPPKPTPVSRFDNSGRTGRIERDDSGHAYAMAISTISYGLRTEARVTATLNVQPNGRQSDVDGVLEKLKERYANRELNSRALLQDIREDPELARKQAEQAEKERIRAARRLENQKQRLAAKEQRTRERAGLGRFGGLTAADLEEDLDGGYGRRGAGAGRAKRRQNRRDRSESEEEAEYDEDDGFVAQSDESEEEIVGDSEPDDLEKQEAIIERREAQQRTPKKAIGGTKRHTPDDEPAEAASQGSPVSRQKRRRVVEEDDE